MSNNFFQFKHFVIKQENCAMKVGTDGVLLGAWTNAEDITNILDAGTGTGLLSLMLAQRSSAYIDAVDIEPSACRQAQENVANSRWKDRIKIINVSLQEYSNCEIKYDLIVCNPPFFSKSLKCDNEKRNMARHNDLLSQIELLEAINKLLAENGKFVLILPFNEGKHFILEGVNYGLYCNRLLKIIPGPAKKINRLVIEMSRLRQYREENELMIHNEDGSYTGAYKNLTQDYYL
jgi:tRNA1Val (adenine37-N6)-methyltransferase